jgi:hypothetical protein
MIETAVLPTKNALLDSLVAEVIDGKPYYYKGYKNVLFGKLKHDDIMGASGLQGLIVGYLMRLLAALDDDEFHILPNETGIHLGNKNNLSGDILIFDASKPIIFDTNYVSRAPDIDIEVDVSIDLENEDEQEYIFKKTEKLLDFGTEKVIWILTKPQKVMIATPHKDWVYLSYNQDVEILRGIIFNIADLLERKKHLLKP